MLTIWGSWWQQHSLLCIHFTTSCESYYFGIKSKKRNPKTKSFLKITPIWLCVIGICVIIWGKTVECQLKNFFFWLFWQNGTDFSPASDPLDPEHSPGQLIRSGAEAWCPGVQVPVCRCPSFLLVSEISVPMSPVHRAMTSMEPFPLTNALTGKAQRKVLSVPPVGCWGSRWWIQS
jgi:hypothetical protein